MAEDKNLTSKVTGLAAHAAMAPVTTAARAVGVAKGAGKVIVGALHRTGDDTSAEGVHEDAPQEASTSAEESSGTGDQGVDLLPYPELEEPVPVVEQVLEAEENGDGPVEGHATEPHASTRDEEHGDAELQRAEVDEIAEEAAEAFPGGDLDLETPVGTTGADVGHNPDTAEADLQQPGTEPLLDPSLTKSVKSEMDRAQDAPKGPAELT